jgi:hypothetical protein
MKAGKALVNRRGFFFIKWEKIILVFQLIKKQPHLFIKVFREEYGV